MAWDCPYWISSRKPPESSGSDHRERDRFPIFPMARADVVGQRIGEVLAAEPGRIAFIGTGGLSHNPPFPEPRPGASRLGAEERAESIRTAPWYIDPEWDRGLLAGMERGDADVLSSLRQEELDRRVGGANEIRT